MICSRILALAAVCGLAVGSANAQILFSDDFDAGTSAANWTTVTSFENPNVGPDSTIDYAFDYSQVTNLNGPNFGFTIPSAPNSVGGTTIGLYQTANNTDNCPGDGAAGCGVGSDGTTVIADEGDSIGSVSLYSVPAGVNYKMTADLYLFWNSGGGSTEYAAVQGGHDGSNNVPLRFSLNLGSGLGYTFDTDGDSGTDILIHDSANGETGLGGWEGIPDGTFPATGAGHDAFSTGANTGGPFSRWVEVEYVSANGQAALYINGALVPGTNVSTSFDGGSVLLGHSDPFNSVNAAIGATGGFTNGSIWDNVVIMQIPEPGTALLVALGLAGLVARRR